ncbi:hypothetical protein HB364_12285 [Pseudoflavitalea sp. X16]|uniref:hypothetical protein n=1 Tax=Paraflavitalea devenefica TaxID=2716334 RepID=UPI00141E8ACD|nr:hypothetical protein [Paraflavitalea devenefica]NII25868.1 hypothetical protein [Paraflavitalea devenefica]
MSTQDPKIKKVKPDKANKPGATEKPGERWQPDPQSPKSRAFDQGLSNNSNTQTGTAQSGYDETNPKQPGGKQQQQPKVTNQENAITNSEEQNNPQTPPMKSGL